MQSTHSSAIINFLREIFGMFGSPKSMVTDNGPQFISSEMEIFLEGEGVRHLRTPTYHPASNGEAERPGDTIWYREPNGKWSPGVLLQPVGERLWELEMEGSTTARTAHLDQIKGRRVGPTRHL
uniref:Integrase catalytic domain-containing protein n=1 Tax=Globodera rostochiensis TaxID=31243 RepID=A0A914IAM3_GLORO